MFRNMRRKEKIMSEEETENIRHGDGSAVL